MNHLKHFGFNFILMLIVDAVWLKFIAGSFFARQLDKIARLDASGAFQVRLLPALLVYFLMALGLEIFIFNNSSIRNLKEHVLYGAFLGLVIYGTFDLTNRAIIEHYPLSMVIVDMSWGTFLFATVSYLNFELRNRLTIF